MSFGFKPPTPYPRQYNTNSDFNRYGLGLGTRSLYCVWGVVSCLFWVSFVSWFCILVVVIVIVVCCVVVILLLVVVVHTTIEDKPRD